MSRSNTSAPTSDQLAALVEYAREHGRHWKADLCSDWTAGRDAAHPLLRQLRNDFGPRWLLKFRLPDLPANSVEKGIGHAEEEQHAI